MRSIFFSLTTSLAVFVAASTPPAFAEELMMSSAPMMAEEEPAMMGGEPADSMMGSGDDAMMSMESSPMTDDPAMAEGAEDVAAEDEKPTAETPAPPVAERLATLQPQFFPESTSLPRLTTRMIPVRAKAATEWRTEVAAKSTDDKIVQILEAPVFLPGRELAFLRVRTLKAGEATVQLGEKGEFGTLKLIVEDLPSETRRHLARPVLTGPQHQSHVLEEFAVGMEMFADARQDLGMSGELRLRVGSDPRSKLLEPVEEIGPVNGPLRRAMFLVDSSVITPGPLKLTPVFQSAEGKETNGDAIFVQVLAPDTERLLQGEAEEHMIAEDDVPQRFGNSLPGIGFDPQASGNAFVLLPRGRPSWLFNIPEVQEPGRYQLLLRVRSTLAGSAFSALKISAPPNRQNIAMANTLGHQWHWIPAGTSLPLKKGENMLGVSLANDFQHGDGADRDLFIDKFVLIKLPDGNRGSDHVSSDPQYEEQSQFAYFEEGYQGRQLRVAFAEVLEGQPVRGQLEVNAAVWRERRNDNKKRDAKLRASTQLLLNGEVAGKSQDDKPTFLLEAYQWKKGVNTLQLRSELASGESALSPIQTVYADAPGFPFKKPAADSVEQTFTVDHDAWSGSSVTANSSGQGPENYRALFSPGSVNLEIPKELVGKMVLRIALGGTAFKGNPEAELTLHHGDQEEVLQTFAGEVNWREYTLKDLNLKEGSKRLEIEFSNDQYDPETRGDRNLYVGPVTLQSSTMADGDAPKVEVLHPKPDAIIAGNIDVVVAEITDNSALASARLLLNDEPFGPSVELQPTAGYLVIPAIFREITGKQSLVVEVTDKAGNTTRSKPISVVAQADADPGATPFHRAVHLIKRFGYGLNDRDLAAVLTEGEQPWLRRQLAAAWDSPSELAAHGSAIVAHPGDRGNNVFHRVLHHALSSPNPARTRLVLWLQNHFSTWRGKVGAEEKWKEHLAFARLGAGSFSDALYTSATSPAMLVYLDQHRSFGKALNENYAREIMELHTLGVHGGYQQEDVTRLASLLTGWHAQEIAPPCEPGGNLRYAFRYDPFLNAPGATEVVGLEFVPEPPQNRFDRMGRFLEMLASHPSTARYLSEKLAGHYTGLPADEGLVEDLTTVFHATGGDLAEVLSAIAEHPVFWEQMTSPRLAQPFDFSLGLLRNSQSSNTWAAWNLADKTGKGLFDRATPDGYPEEDSEYADSNYMLQKWRMAQEIGGDLVRNLPKSFYQDDLQDDPAARQQLIDFAATRTLGRLLTPSSNDAAHALLQEKFEGAWPRNLQLAAFIAQTPEAQTR